jgi:hypothetical protein
VNTRRQIETEVRTLWRNGEVRLSWHAVSEMDADHLDLADVRHVLWYGRIVDEQVGEEGPRYRYHGEAVSGMPTGVVVELCGELVIVTVFLL